ncbi:CHC2 zinc finger domain-containing protein [Bacillota bacterium Meth-B3]
MTRAAIADAIKCALDMRDLADRYGVSAARQNAVMVCCPFHADKTPSMKLFSDGFTCFGCHAHGDQIDFVMALFGVDFWAAATMINADFALGIPIDAPPDDAMRQRASALAARRSARRKALMLAESNYWRAHDRWLLFDRLLYSTEPFSVLWRWAVSRIDNARIDLEDAQTKWIEVRKKRV